MTVVGSVGHGDARRACDRDETRVRLEASPAVDDLVARGGCGRDQLGKHRNGSGADLNLLDCYAVALCEPLAERRRGCLGVAVDRRPGNRLQDGWQRVEGVLVRGQLEGVGRRWPALAIRREGFDVGAQSHSGFGHWLSLSAAAGLSWHSDGMRRFLVRLLINAFALWLTTLIVAGVSVQSYAPGWGERVITFLLVALIFGIVNGIIGNLIRIVAFPLYILTLGLLALVVNALLLLLVAWLSGLLGFGLVIDSFWSGFWGAIVLGLISWLIGIILRPLLVRRN